MVKDEAPRAFGLFHWATNLGVPIASLSAGYFAMRSWKWLFAIDAISALVFALLVFWWISVPPRDTRKFDTTCSLSEGPVSSVTFRFIDVCLIAFGVFAIYFQDTTTLPLSVIDAGHGPVDFGWLLAVNGVLIAVAQPVMGTLFSKMRNGFPIMLGILFTGWGMGLSGASDSFWFLIFTVILWSFGEIILAALTLALVSEMAPVHLRGRYFGIFGTCIGLGRVVAPLGISLYSIHPNLFSWLCAVIPVLLVLLQICLFSGREKRENF